MVGTHRSTLCLHVVILYVLEPLSKSQGLLVDAVLAVTLLSLPVNPHEGLGVKSRMCPPYPQRDRKRRLNGAVCRNQRIKRVVPCRC